SREVSAEPAGFFRPDCLEQFLNKARLFRGQHLSRGLGSGHVASTSAVGSPSPAPLPAHSGRPGAVFVKHVSLGADVRGLLSQGKRILFLFLSNFLNTNGVPLRKRSRIQPLDGVSPPAFGPFFRK